MNCYKKEHNFDFRFEHLIILLAKSDNIILIYHTIIFINVIINSFLQIDKIKTFKSEFIRSGILNSFQVIFNIIIT